MADDDATRPKPDRRLAETEAGNGADQSAAENEAGPDELEVPLEPTPEGAEPSEVAPEPNEVERLRTDLASAQERLLRERAELENFKKRALRERAEALRFASEGLLRDLLPVIDNLERALAHARASRPDDPIVEGIELVLRAFAETLERHGVRAVEARGLPFDPRHHEAVGQVESTLPPNTVVDELRRGYLLHDRLLRPAQVLVGKVADAALPGVEKAEEDG